MIPELLLSIFLGEIQSARVEEWTNQFHAQITVESAWRPDACSIYACGLAQFTLPTWGDIAPNTNPSCEGVDYRDPACSVRSQIVYMSRLVRKYETRTNRDKWQFAWAAYNGGPYALVKDIRKCKSIVGCNPTIWKDNVEMIDLRADWAYKENRAYPKKILREMSKL